MAEPIAEAGARNLRGVEVSGAISEDLVGEYLATLGGRSLATVEAYRRILRQLSAWMEEEPGGSHGLRPDLWPP